MAQHFREFRDLISDYFPHENLVLWWAWLRVVQCSKRKHALLHCTALADGKHMYVCVAMFFHLEVSCTFLSYEGHPDGLKASEARPEF